MKNSLRYCITIFMVTIHVSAITSSFTATTKSLSKSMTKATTVATKSLSGNLTQATKTLEQGLQYSHDILLDKHSTAIHEAGHALLYTLLGDSIKKATIEFADQKYKKMSSMKAVQKGLTMQPVIGGYVQGQSQKSNFNNMPANASEQEKKYINNYRSLQNCYIKTIISLGGIVAEQVFGAYSDLVPRDLAKMVYSDRQATKRNEILKISSNSHGQGDLKNIHKNLSKYFDKKEFDTIIEQCYSITYKILRAHKRELEMIANLLLKKRTISGDQISQLLKLPLATDKNISSDIYAKELTQTYSTTQDYIDGRFLVTDTNKDAYTGYYVTTPSSINPQLTGLKIKIFTIFSDEALQ